MNTIKSDLNYIFNDKKEDTFAYLYSRTNEDGVYKSKLAGTLIQDERNDSCFIGKNSSGIAYFGDLDGNNSVPINDENLIYVLWRQPIILIIRIGVISWQI